MAMRLTLPTLVCAIIMKSSQGCQDGAYPILKGDIKILFCPSVSGQLKQIDKFVLTS